MDREQNIRKKLLFRGNHRGTKELDLLVGGFISNCINSLNEKEIINLEDLLKENDLDLYNWITKKELPPIHYQNSLMQKLQNFKINASSFS